MIRILDDEDEGHLEKLGAYLAGVFRNNGIYFTDKEGAALLKDILATIPAVDDAAVERAANAIQDHVDKGEDVCPRWSDCETAARAAIAALAKAE